jgi:hypothetical protein
MERTTMAKSKSQPEVSETNPAPGTVCESCYYYHKREDYPEFGQCRRNPPASPAVAGYDALGKSVVALHYGYVSATLPVCGEYRGR